MTVFDPRLDCSAAAGGDCGLRFDGRVSDPLSGDASLSPSRSQNFVVELQARPNATFPGWVIASGGGSGDTTSGGVERAISERSLF